MLHLENLTLLGTSHIAIESVQAISKQIKDHKPGIICLELDKNRLQALLKKERRGPSWKDIRQIGFKGYLFLLIGGYIERKLGEQVGLEPGAEMLEAVRQAQEHHIPLALIDQDIAITLKRFSESFSWQERGRFLVDLFNAIFFRKREMRKLGIQDLDLRQVPSATTIEKMIHQVKTRYPNLYRVLIEERNKVMARNIAAILKSHPDKAVLAIVGAGHEKELFALIQKFKQ